MGDLVAACAHVVPVALAARMWRRNHQGGGLGTEFQRARHAIRMELVRYGARVPGIARNRSWPDDAVFTLETDRCLMCGATFLAEKGKRFCTRACTRGGHGLKGEADMARLSLPERAPEAAGSELPEQRALALVIEALRLLGDPEARTRLLDYARTLRIPPAPVAAAGTVMVGPVTITSVVANRLNRPNGVEPPEEPHPATG